MNGRISILKLLILNHFYPLGRLGQPSPKSICNINNPTGLKLLTRLKLGLSHHNSHRFSHNFSNCANPLCSCKLEIEFLSHFFLHCHFFTYIYSTLLEKLTHKSVLRSWRGFLVHFCFILIVHVWYYLLLNCFNRKKKCQPLNYLLHYVKSHTFNTFKINQFIYFLFLMLLR